VGAIALLGFGSFVVVSLAVGARLLALARRTRQVPEAAMGAALFLGGGLGYAAIVLALRVLPAGAAPLPLALGNALVHLGTIALAVGTWRIFRAEAFWPAVAVAFVTGMLGTSFALRLGDLHAIPPPPTVFWTSSLASALVYAWSGAESLRYWTMMRRRAALGLADPALARRFGLWGLGAGCAVGIFVASMIGRLVGRGPMPSAVLGVSSLLGFAAAVSVGLAFFPGSLRARLARPHRPSEPEAREAS